VSASSPITAELPPTLPKLAPISSSAAAPAGEVANTSSSLTMPVTRKRRGKPKAIDSLAVLPLTNAGNDQQMEYLSDGITDSIINSLSQLPKLRVVPRGTVFRYKGNQSDPLEVGRALGVRAVVTGRLLQVGDLLVVRAELIDVGQESQLWGEEYRRSQGDIFTIQ